MCYYYDNMIVCLITLLVHLSLKTWHGWNYLFTCIEDSIVCLFH